MLTLLVSSLSLAKIFAKNSLKVKINDKTGKYGYINAKGKYVIKPQFDRAFDFINSEDGHCALIKQGRYWGLVRPSGKIEDVRSDISQYDARALIRDNEGSYKKKVVDMIPIKFQAKWGFIDYKGNWVIKPQFEKIKRTKELTAFADDLAAVCFDGKWGYIDQNGNVAIGFIFDNAEPFSEQKASVTFNGKNGIIDIKGTFFPITEAVG